eukprot:TRINITY_DN124362_c0_g1_i1.p1 TRINITY_DN124362_c0_g1~~TRINITY_DN124362_c0_g1_i1.p1  ORF type:complete len:256 (+),score=55.93 TRINITY_DN124362_c0_g1_i1:242-1009(+)
MAAEERRLCCLPPCRVCDWFSRRSRASTSKMGTPFGAVPEVAVALDLPRPTSSGNIAAATAAGTSQLGAVRQQPPAAKPTRPVRVTKPVEVWDDAEAEVAADCTEERSVVAPLRDASPARPSSRLASKREESRSPETDLSSPAKTDEAAAEAEADTRYGIAYINGSPQKVLLPVHSARTSDAKQAQTADKPARTEGLTGLSSPTQEGTGVSTRAEGIDWQPSAPLPVARPSIEDVEGDEQTMCGCGVPRFLMKGR